MAVRTVKSKKTIEEPVEETETVKTTKIDPFAALLKNFSDLQSEFELLQKEITKTKESWSLEQKNHDKDVEDRNIQEELERKRNKETYEYETARRRKIAEDEFTDKKAIWEKQLKDQQEILNQEKAELIQLRKTTDGFDGEKEKAVSTAQELLRKELVSKFETERKMKEQEQKSEKDILNLKINNLTTENNRLNTEIEVLKKALEDATRQVKEIAVKVIESGTKPQQNLTNDL
ncbi:hypothetical protein HYT74_00365 [Candidatus Daviesbacteria bacterium]|nr:hypothetical protein [Candidatus Daviesbacteria bacterium]